MSKFIISLDQDSIATQVSSLLNKNNKLKQYYTSSKILSNNTQYCLELGGYNERDFNKKRKVLGVVGYSYLSKEVTLIKHLCVHDNYRNKGIATSILKQVITICPSEYIQMRVRNDNTACLNLAERLGFVYIYHETMNNYYVLVLGRKIGVRKKN